MDERLKKLAEKYVTNYWKITNEERNELRSNNITFNQYCGVTDICKNGARVGKSFYKKDTRIFKWY